MSTWYVGIALLNSQKSSHPRMNKITASANEVVEHFGFRIDIPSIVTKAARNAGTAYQAEELLKSWYFL